MNIKRLLNLFGVLSALLILLTANQLVDVQALLGDVDVSGMVDDAGAGKPQSQGRKPMGTFVEVKH